MAERDETRGRLDAENSRKPGGGEDVPLLDLPIPDELERRGLERTAIQVGPDEEVYGITAAFTRRVSRMTSFRLWGQAYNIEFEGPTPNRTRWQVGIGLNRQFSRNFSGRIEARHTTQDSDDPSLSYDENRITLSLTKEF